VLTPDENHDSDAYSKDDDNNNRVHLLTWTMSVIC